MADYVQDSFDEVVPGAGDKAELFLQVVRDKAAQASLGLDFKPVVNKKTGALTLQASIQFGRFNKGSPMTVVVHADSIGSALQVGWQLTEKGMGQFSAGFASQQHKHASMQMVNMKPENQRQLAGVLGAFHKIVFLPVLHMLVSAIEAESGPAGGSGFLGA